MRRAGLLIIATVALLQFGCATSDRAINAARRFVGMPAAQEQLLLKRAAKYYNHFEAGRYDDAWAMYEASFRQANKREAWATKKRTEMEGKRIQADKPRVVTNDDLTATVEVEIRADGPAGLTRLTDKTRWMWREPSRWDPNGWSLIAEESDE